MLGALTFVLFAVVAFRLWYLQVLTGPQNVALATANVERSIPVPAPRGEILDRNGNVLATTTGAARVSIVADDLPGAGDATPALAAADPRRLALYDRLARVLGVTTRLHRRDRQRPADPRLPARGDPERRRHLRALLPRRAPQPVPRRRRPADQPARLPAGRHRLGRARRDRADLQERAGDDAVPGDPAGRLRRPGRARGDLPVLPAGQGRRREGPGQRLRSAHRQGAGAHPADSGRHAADLAGPRPRARGLRRAAPRDGRRALRPGAPSGSRGRVLRDGPGQREGARARIASHLQRQRLRHPAQLQAVGAAQQRDEGAARRPRRRPPTTRRARRSSRSPRSAR